MVIVAGLMFFNCPIHPYNILFKIYLYMNRKKEKVNTFSSFVLFVAGFTSLTTLPHTSFFRKLDLCFPTALLTIQL